MFAAQVWTYWFAPLLLAAAVVMVVASAAGYYRKVGVPQYLLVKQRMLEHQGQLREKSSVEPSQAAARMGGRSSTDRRF